MGLIKYGVAVGIGYHFAQPQGRQQLLWLRQRAIDLARHPAVRQLRERGWEIAAERALAAKNLAAKNLVSERLPAKVGGWRRPRPHPVTTPAADGTAPTGFDGRTVAEDSQAAMTGIAPPPPAGRVSPASGR